MDLLFEPEASKLIRAPQETMRYWRWQGKGPAWSKLGRRIVYDRADLQAWVDANRHVGKAGDAG